MSVAQIVDGVFFCIAGHLKLGTSMVLNGIFDVHVAVGKKEKIFRKKKIFRFF
jgi:hypothetical protein